MTLVVDVRLATYVAKPGTGICLFASSRESLLAAAPQHAAAIDEEIGPLQRQRPCWLLVLDDDADVAVGTERVSDAPRWWIGLHLCSGNSMKGERL